MSLKKASGVTTLLIVRVWSVLTEVTPFMDFLYFLYTTITSRTQPSCLLVESLFDIGYLSVCNSRILSSCSCSTPFVTTCCYRHEADIM